MRKEGMYMLGTASEIAEDVAKNIVEGARANYGSMRKFKNFDFALSGDFDDLSKFTCKEIADGSDMWYGMKKLYTGFNNPELDLFADYYGGGSGVYGKVDFDSMEEECKKTIEKMILESLGKCMDNAKKRALHVRYEKRAKKLKIRIRFENAM